jgi:hypothetical protein
MLQVARQDRQTMAPRRRRDEKVGQPGRVTLSARAVGQCAGATAAMADRRSHSRLNDPTNQVEDEHHRDR